MCWAISTVCGRTSVSGVYCDEASARGFQFFYQAQRVLEVVKQPNLAEHRNGQSICKRSHNRANQLPVALIQQVGAKMACVSNPLRATQIQVDSIHICHDMSGSSEQHLRIVATEMSYQGSIRRATCLPAILRV